VPTAKTAKTAKARRSRVDREERFGTRLDIALKPSNRSAIWHSKLNRQPADNIQSCLKAAAEKHPKEFVNLSTLHQAVTQKTRLHPSNPKLDDWGKTHVVPLRTYLRNQSEARRLNPPVGIVSTVRTVKGVPQKFYRLTVDEDDYFEHFTQKAHNAQQAAVARLNAAVGVHKGRNGLSEVNRRTLNGEMKPLMKLLATQAAQEYMPHLRILITKNAAKNAAKNAG